MPKQISLNNQQYAYQQNDSQGDANQQYIPKHTKRQIVNHQESGQKRQKKREEQQKKPVFNNVGKNVYADDDSIYIDADNFRHFSPKTHDQDQPHNENVPNPDVNKKPQIHNKPKFPKEELQNLIKKQKKDNLSSEKQENDITKPKSIQPPKPMIKNPTEIQQHIFKHKHHKHHTNPKNHKSSNSPSQQSTNIITNQESMTQNSESKFNNNLNVTQIPLEESSTEESHTAEDEDSANISEKVITPDDLETSERSSKNDIDNRSDGSNKLVGDDSNNADSVSDKKETLRHINKENELSFSAKKDEEKEPAEDEKMLDLLMSNGDKYKHSQTQLLKDYESDEFIKYLIENDFIDKSALITSTNQDGYFEIPIRVNDQVFILARRKWLSVSKSNGVLLTLFLPVSACFFLTLLIYLFINDRLLQSMNRGLQRLMKIENQSSKMFEFKMIETYEYIHVNVNMSYFNHNFNSNISRMPYNNILMSGGTANFKSEYPPSQIMDSINMSAITLKLDDDLQIPATNKLVEGQNRKYHLMKRKKNITKKRKQDKMMRKKLLKGSDDGIEALIDDRNPMFRNDFKKIKDPLEMEKSIHEIKVCFDNEENQLQSPEDSREKYVVLSNPGDTKIQMSSYGNLGNAEKEKDHNKIYEI